MELLLLLGLVGGGWWLWQRRADRPEAAGDTWSVTTPPAAGVPGVVPRGSHAAVLRALTRAEAGRHAGSMPFVFGVVLAALCVLAMTGWVDVYDNAAVTGRMFLHLGGLAYPVTGMALLAANRAALRDRREGTTELMRATPTGDTTRTGAWMLAGWPAVVVAGLAALVVTALTVTGRTESNPSGPWGPHWLPEVLLAFVLVAGGVALGVALARWLPHGIVAPLALVGILFATLALNEGVRPRTDRIRSFAPWTTPPRHLAPDFMTHPSWAHLIYVVGLVGIVVMLAILRSRRDRIAYGMLGVTIVVATVGAVVQFQRPSPSEVRAIAARINARGTTCTTADSIQTCTYPGFEDWATEWREAARAVFGVVPAPTSYAAIQSVGDAGRRSLDPEVRRLVATRGTGYGFGSMGDGDRQTDEAARFVLPAHAAVGLPRRVGADGEPCFAGGQARAVVAIWALLATNDEDLGAWELAVDEPDSGIGETWDAKRMPWVTAFWPADWDTDVDAPVLYATTDARLAIELARRGDTRRELAADWDRWTGPTTTSTELAQALGAPDFTDATTTKRPEGLRACT